MIKYLYGAAVQGIQDFIFQTNKLREIVGASELVEQVCTTEFAKALGLQEGDKSLTQQLKDDKNAIVNAAGNIKYVFDNYEVCQSVVLRFPMQIVSHAPGITISQAVVKYEDPSSEDNHGQTESLVVKNFEEAVQKLEEELRSQRNKPMLSSSIGLMSIERSRQTGLPVISTSLGHYDEGTYRKLFDEEKRRNATTMLCKNSFGTNVRAQQIPFNISDITDDNEWIAIIHADGNGLGQVVQKIGTEKEFFKKFSQDLDVATKLAAQKAYQSLIDDNSIDIRDNKKIPIRPIVLSGDDHTLICRGDIALPYVKTFIEEFEANTEKLLADKLNGVFTDKSKKLSACAGIAFIKSSYPFYYGYQLAEELCSKAKKHTKDAFGFKEGNLPASCIMFHKVQDSFVSNYEDIVKRELTPNKECSLKFGPYYINKVAEGCWKLETLLEKVKDISSEDMSGIKNGLRRWLSVVAVNMEAAHQLQNRLESNYEEGKKYTKQIDFLKSVFNQVNPSPIYDILTLNTINTQKTK